MHGFCLTSLHYKPGWSQCGFQKSFKDCWSFMQWSHTPV